MVFTCFSFTVIAAFKRIIYDNCIGHKVSFRHRFIFKLTAFPIFLLWQIWLLLCILPSVAMETRHFITKKLSQNVPVIMKLTYNLGFYEMIHPKPRI
jgi:hypothetical protein